MNQITNLLHNLKIVASAIIAIVVAFLMPVVPLIIVVGVFIFADTVVGLWRAKKMGENITSKKLSNIVSKMVLYQSAIILFFILEKYILSDMVGYFVSIPWFITKLIACTLCSIEIKSIDESVKIMTDVSMWARLKLLLKRSSDLKKEIEDLVEGKNSAEK